MVKKLQKSAADKPSAAAGLLDSQLAQTVKDSAQQIWLAGLGAFAKAQGSGGKVFETLMKEGVNLQRKTQATAGEKIGDMADKMTAMAGEVGHKANAQWDKLETIFEERTARALSRLGVPSAKELAALAARVDALAAALARLGGSAEGAAKVPKFRPGKALRNAVNAAPPAAAKKAAIRRKVTAQAAEPAAKSATKPAAAPRKRAARAA